MKLKIVVRGTNWIGDAVMQIPALRELRRIFPEAFIALHTRAWAQGIYENAEFIDEILAFEKNGSKIKDALRQARILRDKNFDVALLFPNSFESALIARMSGIPRRFGYATDGRSFLLTDAVKVPEWKNKRHEVFYYLNLAREVERKFAGTETISIAEPKTNLNVAAAGKKRARELLLENGADLSKKIVALGVGSANSRAKRWQAGGYAELNEKLQTELDANVILIGVADELDVSREVYEKSKRKPIILTGKTNLAEATAILSEIDLLVSNDMGLAHIASAAGTATLVIFGPTDPNTTRPWNAEIIYKNVECSPCMLRDCPIDHRCMTRISAAEVFSACRKKLFDDEADENR